jgi:hypothetical protein
MVMKQFKITDWICIFSIGIALLILMDFVLPGKTITETVFSIKKQHQQYYNAGGNHHNSYRLITNTTSFNISKSFAEKAKSANALSYTISTIFNEVNGYAIPELNEGKSIYSLRIISGLVLPLLGILVMIIALKNKIGILSFVFQILIILDFVYLLL